MVLASRLKKWVCSVLNFFPQFRLNRTRAWTTEWPSHGYRSNEHKEIPRQGVEPWAARMSWMRASYVTVTPARNVGDLKQRFLTCYKWPSISGARLVVKICLRCWFWHAYGMTKKWNRLYCPSIHTACLVTRTLGPSRSQWYHWKFGNLYCQDKRSHIGPPWWRGHRQDLAHLVV